MQEAKMSDETLARRKRATAKVGLRLLAAERAHGIHRPDAAEFEAKMRKQAKGDK